jgi:c-di-GMP-binding flagellar brake protein YcgR
MAGLTIGEVIRISFSPWNAAEYQEKEPPNNPGVIKEVRERTLVVQVADKEGGYGAVSAGDEIVLLSAAGGKCWIYAGIIEAVLHQSPLLLEVSTPKPPVEVQRRAFYRIDLELQARYSPASQPGKWRKATVRDISEGGACLTDTQPLKEGERLLVEVSLEKETVSVKGVIRRCYAEGPVYLLGVQFCDVGGPDQQRVRKFIFTQQLRRPKK